MFVIDKRDNKKYMVCAVRDNKNGFPHFLIYRNNQWEYSCVKHFVPADKKES